jgi:hypothetical protein
MSDVVNVTPEESFLEGCPDPTAGRAITVVAGSAGNVVYQMRDGNGVPIDMAALGYDEAPYGVWVLLSNALCPHAPVYVSASAAVSSGDPTSVVFAIPPQAAAIPGIYLAEIWIVSDIDEPETTGVIVNKALVSVEASLLSRKLGNTTPGPITVQEVRLQLRDFPELNTYWQQREFSLAEVVHSILQPIYVWNETPPDVIRYDAGNFPYRNKWLEAAAANLMRIAANWLVRNSRTIKYGDGMTESDKDKFQAYYTLSEAKWQEYKQFCADQKVALNLRSGVGIHG